MLYRRNEKGCYEAVTDKGEVIAFEDKHEMIEFIKIREELCYILGKEPERAEFSPELCAQADEPCAESVSVGKRVSFFIHEGEYEYLGAELKKKALA